MLSTVVVMVMVIMMMMLFPIMLPLSGTTTTMAELVTTIS